MPSKYLSNPKTLSVKKVVKNLKKAGFKKLNLKWMAKAGVVLVLMRIKFNNHNSGHKILIKLLIFCSLNCDY